MNNRKHDGTNYRPPGYNTLPGGFLFFFRNTISKKQDIIIYNKNEDGNETLTVQTTPEENPNA